MDCPFVVGQRVECILEFDPVWHYTLPGVTFPRLKHVYTVRALIDSRLIGSSDPTIGVKLKEIVNPLNGVGREYCFDYTAFRAVTERKTDISVFERLLAPSPRVLEDA